MVRVGTRSVVRQVPEIQRPVASAPGGAAHQPVQREPSVYGTDGLLHLTGGNNGVRRLERHAAAQALEVLYEHDSCWA